jgi:hypothetical protein
VIAIPNTINVTALAFERAALSAGSAETDHVPSAAAAAAAGDVDRDGAGAARTRPVSDSPPAGRLRSVLRVTER